ncbi:MAG TPA: hypothetical protein VFY48_05965 [Solirubrobacterales bacterium]|nr:hypothetical protein [Solirubrobacterales bacterium]
MLKKITVLAVAVGVVAALALPATASATWKHHSTDIAQDVQFNLTGQARFETGFGGAECQVAIKVKLYAGQTTGVVETWGPHPTNETTNCKGLSGAAFCQAHDFTPLAPNWPVHTSEGAIKITTQNITSQPTGGFCPVNQLTLTPGTVTATPNQPNTFSSFSLSGNLVTHKRTTGNGETETGPETQISGTVSVTSPNSSTYSI